MAKKKGFDHEAEDNGPMIVQASNSLKAIKIFCGDTNKTLKQVGKEYNLSDEDVRYAYTNLKDGSEARHLSVTLENIEYIIPFSRGSEGSNPEKELSLNTILNNGWIFRAGFMSVKDDDGAPKEVDGVIVLADGTNGNPAKPYMSIGLPGLNITRREDGWEDDGEPEEEIIADAAPAKTGKVLTPKEKAALAKGVK